VTRTATRLLSAGEGVTLRGWPSRRIRRTVHGNTSPRCTPTDADARNARTCSIAREHGEEGGARRLDRWRRSTGPCSPASAGDTACPTMSPSASVCRAHASHRYPVRNLLRARAARNVASTSRPLRSLAAGVAARAVRHDDRWSHPCSAIAMASIALAISRSACRRPRARAAATAAVADRSCRPGFSCRAVRASASRCSPVRSARSRPRVDVRGAGVTAAAQVGVAPVLIPVFVDSTVPAREPRGALAAPLTKGVASGVAGGVVRPLAPQVTALLTVPTRACCTLVTVADLAPRSVTSTVVPRGLVAIGAPCGSRCPR
jgi:hypothetical protein